MKKVFLGLGSNIGDREANLRIALENIEERIGRILLSSSVYETEPWGFHAEELFLNMVVGVETSLRLSGLLGRILMIEAGMGRLRTGRGYASRIIDIDILLCGDRIVDTKSISIPHPKMQERRFVLVPLCEIAPDTVHPVLGKDVKTLLKESRDKGKVRLINRTLRPPKLSLTTVTQ